MLRSLGESGRITFCGVQPGDKKLRKTCGLRLEQRDEKNKVQADAFEMDFIKVKRPR